MATRKLKANVWVGGKLYAADSTPPKDVADQITNPAAWGEETEAEKPKSTRKAADK